MTEAGGGARADRARWVMALIAVTAAPTISYFVLRPLGEPTTVWLWCSMLRLC